MFEFISGLFTAVGTISTGILYALLSGCTTIPIDFGPIGIIQIICILIVICSFFNNYDSNELINNLGISLAGIFGIFALPIILPWGISLIVICIITYYICDYLS